MKNWCFITLYLTVLFLSACQYRHNKLIRNYEFTANQIQVLAIKSEQPFMPIYANDSIKILELEYTYFLAEKLKSIENQMNVVIKKIEHTENELKTIKNPLMIAAVKSRIKLMIIEQHNIENLLKIYKNTPEKTQLQAITKRLEHLKIIPDSLLGYTLKIVFTGRQGDLPAQLYPRKYLFNCEKDSILTTY